MNSFTRCVQQTYKVLLAEAPNETALALQVDIIPNEIMIIPKWSDSKFGME